MAREPFGHVEPGKGGQLFASEINAWNRVAKAQGADTGGAGASFSRDAVYAKIENSTGGDLERGQIVKLGQPVFWDDDPEKQDSLTRGVPLLRGEGASIQVTDSEEWQAQWAATRELEFQIGVVQDFIKEDEVGSVAIAGCCWCIIKKIPGSDDGEGPAGKFVLPAPSGSGIDSDTVSGYLCYNAGGSGNLATDAQPIAGFRVLWASAVIQDEDGNDDEHGARYAFISLTPAREPTPQRSGIFAMVLDHRDIDPGRWCYQLAEVIPTDIVGGTGGTFPDKPWDGDGGGDLEDFDRDADTSRAPIQYRYNDGEGFVSGTVGFYNLWEATFQDDGAHGEAETAPVQGEDENGDPEETEEAVWRVEPLPIGTLVWVPLPYLQDSAGNSQWTGVRPDGKWDRPTGFFYAANTAALLDMIQETVTKFSFEDDTLTIEKARIRYFGGKDELDDQTEGAVDIEYVSNVEWDQENRRIKTSKATRKVLGADASAATPTYIPFVAAATLVEDISDYSGTPGWVELLRKQLYLPAGCTASADPIETNLLQEMSLELYDAKTPTNMTIEGSLESNQANYNLHLQTIHYVGASQASSSDPFSGSFVNYQ